jgi:hypothetical protein
MFCKNCGKEVEEGSKFCTSCGAQMAIQSQAAVQSAEVNSGITTKQLTRNDSDQVNNRLGRVSLVLTCLASIIGVVGISYMIIDGWFETGDYFIGLLPINFFNTLCISLGVVSIYRNKNEFALVGLCIAIPFAVITSFIGFIAYMNAVLGIVPY